MAGTRLKLRISQLHKRLQRDYNGYTHVFKIQHKYVTKPEMEIARWRPPNGESVYVTL